MKPLSIEQSAERRSPPRGISAAYLRLRNATQRAVESRFFTVAVTLVIAINAVSLGLETWPLAAQTFGDWLFLVDRVALILFSIELSAKIWVYRGRFFRSGWNLFDLTIVALSWLPTAGPLAVLRTLRVLRAFRLMSAVPQMRSVVGALLGALPGMASIVAVLLLIFYVAAVMTTMLFGAEFPHWFGTIGASMFSLFQVMTLESWSMGIVRPVMEVYPMAWAFFVPFVIVTSFAVLNLFIALIVNSMQTLHDEDRYRAEVTAALAQDDRNSLHIEIAALRAELRRIADRMPDKDPASQNRG